MGILSLSTHGESDAEAVAAATAAAAAATTAEIAATDVGANAVVPPACWDNMLQNPKHVYHFLCYSDPDGNILGIMIGEELNTVEPKYLGHMTWEDVYSLHAGTAPEPVSMSTIRRAYEKFWRPVVKFRGLTQHARCATCARLSAQRKKANDNQSDLTLLLFGY